MELLQSEITCPRCGFKSVETMSTDACQYFYDCSGLAEQLPHLQLGVVSATRLSANWLTPQRASSRCPLVICPALDGWSLSHQCSKKWAHALPLHWPILSCHDHPFARDGELVRQSFGLALVGHDDPHWEQSDLVGDRTCVGPV